MSKKNSNIISALKSNVAPGLVVFLVALPLCLGIALASGAPPMAGIISGIIGGVIVGFLSNSPISVSGPAAGLTAIILTAITELGSFEIFLCAGIVAGIIQIILGLIKAGSISNYFPSNVIEGMLAGIGVIIIFKQLPYAFGTAEGNIASEELFEHGYSLGAISSYLKMVVDSAHLGAIVISSISVVVLILWNRSKRLSSIKLLPGALVIVIISILMNELFGQMGSSLYLDPDHRVALPVISGLSEISSLFVMPKLSALFNPQVWVVGATIAIVASIETLLCVEAADKMDPQKRVTNTNRELLAQGAGNLASSFLGGLPMTSVVVRSSANVAAGATSKMASIIHGIFLAVSVLAIPFILNLIPLATLAAVLLLVGYKLANPAHIKHFWKKGIYQFLPFMATMLAVVFTDLLMGVAIGMVISLSYILLGNMKRAYHLNTEELSKSDKIHMTLSEEVSFLNKAAIKQNLMEIHEGAEVTIDASKSTYIAHDVLELIQEFANFQAKERNIKLNLIGFKASYSEATEESDPHVRLTYGTVL